MLGAGRRRCVQQSAKKRYGAWGRLAGRFAVPPVGICSDWTLSPSTSSSCRRRPSVCSTWFVVLLHHRRKVVHFNVTDSPTAAWTERANTFAMLRFNVAGPRLLARMLLRELCWQTNPRRGDEYSCRSSVENTAV